MDSLEESYEKMRKINIKKIFLVSGHGLACQQEISLVLTKTPPIHYYTTDEWPIQKLHGADAYSTHVHFAYGMTHLYTNRIYVCDHHHTIILVSWIETLIFLRGELFK